MGKRKRLTVIAARTRRMGECTVFTGPRGGEEMGEGMPSHSTSNHWSHVLSGRRGTHLHPIILQLVPGPFQGVYRRVPSPWPGQDAGRVSPSQDRMGLPPPPTPAGPAKTAYAVAGKPLAFTQEDLLFTSYEKFNFDEYPSKRIVVPVIHQDRFLL